MKKFLRLTPAILIACSILISSCDRFSQDLEKKRKDRETETSVTESLEETSETEATTDNVVPEKAPTPEPEIVTVESFIYADDEIPVYVDWDNYEPNDQKDHQNIYKRESNDFVKELIPSDSYGRVFPYHGSYTLDMDAETLEDSYIGHNLYGFCTYDGTIISDPYYSSVSRCTAGVYTVTTGNGDTERYGLITEDGSKATGCIYSDIQYESNRYYAVKGDISTGKGSITIYDTDLNVVMDETKFSVDLKPITNDQGYEETFWLGNYSGYNGFLDDRFFTISSTSGAILVDIKTGKQLNDHNNYGITANGSLIGINFDPFSAQMFDTEGNALTESFEAYIYNCDGFVGYKDHNYYVFDNKGDLVCEIPGVRDGSLGLGKYFAIRKDSDWTIYDLEGNVITKDIAAAELYNVYIDDAEMGYENDHFLVMDGSYDYVNIYDPLTGKQLNTRYSICMSGGDEYIFTSMDGFYHYSKDFELITECTDGMVSSVLKDEKTGKFYAAYNIYGPNYTGGNLYLYDMTDRKFLDNIKLPNGNLQYIYDGKLFNMGFVHTEIIDIGSGEIIFDYEGLESDFDD